jgi:hypothetical protein
MLRGGWYFEQLKILGLSELGREKPVQKQL